MSATVFISYRRTDTGTARRLYDRLADRLGSERLFLDTIDQLQPGQDFARAFRERIAKCDVVLAVIGPAWIWELDNEGERLLDAPDDPVRIELAAALELDKLVIPILCNGASMPTWEQLPDQLKPLATRYPLRVEHATFAADVSALERALEGLAVRAEARFRDEQTRHAQEAPPTFEAQRSAAEDAARAEAMRAEVEARRRLEEGSRKRRAEEPHRQESRQSRETAESVEWQRRAAAEAARAEAMRAEREAEARRPQPDASPSARSGGGVDLLEIRRGTATSPVASSEPVSRPATRPEPRSVEAEMPHSVPPPGMASGRMDSRLGWIKYALWALLAGTALYVLSRRGLPGVFGNSDELIPPALGAAMAGGARRRAGSDDVDMSAFAPEHCCKGNTFLVQVLFHRPDAGDVPAMALRSDPAARLRAQKTLLFPVAIGERVQLTVSAAGCDLEDESDTIVWRGATTSTAFIVRVPGGFTGDAVAVTVRAFRQGEPVGRIGFTVPVRDTLSLSVRVAGDEARRYNQTFFSYASPDRPIVMRYTHAWSLMKMRFFQDFLSLDPGERWERRLYEEIDRSDLFLLFWSSSASQSEYVRKEAEYALMRRASGQELDILPVVIEGPPCPTPPDTLSAIHFNDRHSYVVKAVMDEAAGRAAH